MFVEDLYRCQLQDIYKINEITRLPCSLVPVEEMIKKTHVMVNTEFE